MGRTYFTASDSILFILFIYKQKVKDLEKKLREFQQQKYATSKSIQTT